MKRMCIIEISSRYWYTEDIAVNTPKKTLISPGQRPSPTVVCQINRGFQSQNPQDATQYLSLKTLVDVP